MSVTATPVFEQTPQLHSISMSTANTARDASGTLSSAVTAGANGSMLHWIDFAATVTTAAGTLRIFYAEDGSTYKLLGEVATTGITASGSVAAENKVWTPPNNEPMPLKANSTLKFCPNNSEAWNVHVNM